MSIAPPTEMQRPAPVGRSRNMIAVASGKGGVGKTWFAVTLSQALANAGRRTLLFDGDLGLANVDIQLGLMPKDDLAGVLGGRLSVAEAAMHYADGGFDVIAGRAGSGRLADLAANRVQILIDSLASLALSYDHVILDLGAGVERTVRQLAAHAGTCIVVTTDEPTSLTDAYAFLKLLHHDQPDADLRVVVNMAGSAGDGERTYGTLIKACEGFLKFSPPLLGIVRRDQKVPLAIRSQSPTLTRYPSCTAALDVEAIAASLLDLQ